MSPQPRYSAERAANVVLGLAAVAAVIGVSAGILRLRDGGSAGWLLIGVGIAPLIAALLIWRAIRRSGE